jgi:hypothetical protein
VYTATPQSTVLRFGCLVATAVALTSDVLIAAQPRQGLASAPWPLEAIELKDGRRLEGLVLAPDDVTGTPAHDIRDIEFVQVVRRPGRPMHLISWPPFPGTRVHFVERLAGPQRDELRTRIEAFRKERLRQEDVTSVRLSRQGEDAPWRYDDPSFVLLSTAPPTITREAVVRLVLTFDALESLVPPVAEPSDRLTVRLCGSLAEYRSVQAELGLRLDNPAFYVPRDRLLVAGSELPQLLEEQRAADDQLDAARQRHLEHGNLLDERLRLLVADLAKSGMPKDERSEIVRRARLRGLREQAEAMASIEAARRANADTVEQARRRFHERLAHEAWHAYADARLRISGGRGLPTWLDEGLAQVVESAPLEAGELRLDAPDPTRLARIKEAIAAGAMMPAAELVSSGQDAFVGGHRGDESVAYLAAWAIAFDLGVLHPVLTAERIVALSEGADDDAIPTFEKLVGMPIDHYDRQWRLRILDANPRVVIPPSSVPPPAQSPAAHVPGDRRP